MLKTKHSKLVNNVLVWAISDEELDSDLESDKAASDPKGKMIPQKLEASQTIDRSRQTDTLQIAGSSNSISDSDLLRSLQNMKTEEQDLIEQKQRLVAAQQNLQNKLFKEIEKRKAMVAHLRTEITDLENRTKQLGEALGIDIYKKTQLETNSPMHLVTKVEQALPECVGLLKCPKPEVCRSYDSCLKKYMNAEMRNEVLKF